MSFTVSEVKNSSLLSKAANDYLIDNFAWVSPSERHIFKLSLPRNLIIKPFFLRSETAEILDSILNFKVLSNDVFICSLPKCGSSWVQSIVWLLTHNMNYAIVGKNSRDSLMGDFDHFPNVRVAKEKSRKLVLNDTTKSLNENVALSMEWTKVHEYLPSPRVIKSHLPPYLLPKGVWSNGAKIIYVIRNPKDMAVSQYHYFRNIYHFDLTLDDVVNGITNDAWFASPSLDHVLNFWKLKHLSNIFIVTYEDLVNDSFATIKKISEFLGYTYDDEELMDLTRFISFANMSTVNTFNRENDVQQMENYHGGKRLDPKFKFLRKGKVGSYSDDLNEDQIKKLDDWTDKIPKDADFKFKL